MRKSLFNKKPGDFSHDGAALYALLAADPVTAEQNYGFAAPALYAPTIGGFADAAGGDAVALKSWGQLFNEGLWNNEGGSIADKKNAAQWAPPVHDSAVALAAFAVSPTGEFVEDVAKYFFDSAAAISKVGFVVDIGFTLVNAALYGPPYGGTYTKVAEQFIDAAPGLIAGGLLLAWPIDGLLGVGVGIFVAVGGVFASDAIQSTIDYFSQVGSTAVVEKYFISFFQPVIALSSEFTTVENSLTASIDQALVKPTLATLGSGLQTLTNDTETVITDLRLATLGVYNEFNDLDNFLTRIAVINGGAGSPIGILIAAAQILLYHETVNLVDTFLSINKVENSLLASIKTAGATITADAAAVTANPADTGALEGGYIAVDTLNAAILADYKSLQAIEQTTVLSDPYAPNFGNPVASPVTNGTITGTTAGDILVGTTGADIFDGLGVAQSSMAGAATQDIEIGGGGADVFLFDQGYGALDLLENDPSGTSSALLKLGSSITESMIHFSATTDGSVLLTIGSSGDSVLLDEQLAGGQYGVAGVVLTSNNTTLTRAQLAGMANVATTGADVLYGTAAGETFNGLGGGDTIVGGGGGDVFIFDRSYGALTIDESDPAGAPNNSLHFGANIAPTDVHVTADANGDLLLAVSNNGTATADLVTVTDELSGLQSGVQSVVFSNGTTWTHAQLLQFTAVATTGADVLYLSSAGTIDGLGGGDIIHGSGGADTFLFDKGYGALEVAEQTSTGAASKAILHVGGGLSLSGLTYSTDAAGDVFVHFSATDIVKLDSQLTSSSDGVAKITDSANDTLTAAQLAKLALTGGAGTILYGTSGPDSFSQLGHGDVAVGYGGNDAFGYTAGAGAAEIMEQDYNTADHNILTLTNVTSTQLTFTLVPEVQFGTTIGESVQITDGTGGDAILIDGMAGDSSQGVQLLKLAGSNVSYTRNQIVALATGVDTITGVGTASAPLQGGAGDNIITTTAANAFIASSGLYDLITAKFGTTNIKLSANGTALPHDARIVLGRGHNIVSAADGNIVVSGVAGSDVIALGNGYSSITGGGGGNTLSALGDGTAVTLGSATAASSGNTINIQAAGNITLFGASNVLTLGTLGTLTIGSATDLSSGDTVVLTTGGTVDLFGNTSQIFLGTASQTDNTQLGGSTVMVSGTGDSITVYPSNGDMLSDTATSSSTTFTLNDPLGGRLALLGKSDVAFISGGSVALTDGGTGASIYVAGNADLRLTGFTADSTSLLSLLPAEGYTTLSGLLAALKSDGAGGSFLALGGTLSGIDFVGVSVSALTTFANSGTHFAFDQSFPHGG